jgi:lysophospholipase L1-like esterase
MTLPQSRWWKGTVRLAAALSVVLLWSLTAGEDSEWQLWRRYSAPQAGINLCGSLGLLALGYLLSGPGTIITRLARVVVLAASTAGTLAALELPAVFGHDYGQTFGTRDNDTWHQVATGINRRDDELIHVHQPHSRFRGTVGGNLARLGLPNPARYDVDVAYDGNGFRNDVDFTQADIVAIGDSFVEGAEVARSETVVAQLGQRLGVPVVNLGQSGYGPQQELIVLKRYGVPLSPKTVVWFLFGGNDPGDVDAYEWRRAHLDEFLSPPSFGTRTFTRNALTAFARLTTLRRRTPSATARRHEITYARPDGSSEIMYLDAPEDEWQPHQWEVMSSTLLGARDVASRIGANLLVVYVPRKLRVYRGFLRAAPDAYAHRWPSNNLPEIVAAYCQQHVIPFLDATVPLRRAVAAGTSVYLPDDVHWNPAGHRVVAAAVADSIQQIGTPSPRAFGASK